MELYLVLLMKSITYK